MTIGTKESEFTVFEDGTYEVGFGAWFPVDDSGLPSLVLQERFGEEVLVIRGRTTIGEGDGPPFTIAPGHELLPLVKAFGGDPAKLRDEKDIGRKLLKDQKMMTGTTKVTVGNGWIQNNSIEGIGVPEGFYYIKLVGITSKNELGEIAPIEGKFGPYSIGRVRVTRGDHKDFEVTFLLDYPLVLVDMTDEDGNVILDSEGNPEKVPAMPLKSDGTLTASSKRFKNFLLAFYGPDYGAFPHQDCQDVSNIMPLLNKISLGRKLEALGRIDNNRLDLNSLGPISDEEKELLEEEKEEGLFTEVQEGLRMMLISEVGLCENFDAFVDDKSWDLTSEGKKWAMRVLAGKENPEDPVDSQSILAKYDLNPIFSEWNDKDIKNVLKALGYKVDGSRMKEKKEEAQF